MKSLILFFTLISNPMVFCQFPRVEFFPEESIYSKYFADALSHQFSLLKHFESDEWFGNIGVERPLVNFDFGEDIYQFTIAATVFNTLKITFPPRVRVYTTDYLLDLFIDKDLGKNYLIRFNWGHLSAHYSDDGIIDLKKIPINYIRDYIGLQSEKLFEKFNGKIYMAFAYSFHNEPRRDRHIRFQFGFDAGKQLTDDILIYFAFDFKMKAEVDYGTTKDLQTGIKLFSKKKSSIRFTYNYRMGYDVRGQLYNTVDDKHLFGMYIDF